METKATKTFVEGTGYTKIASFAICGGRRGIEIERLKLKWKSIQVLVVRFVIFVVLKLTNGATTWEDIAFSSQQ